MSEIATILDLRDAGKSSCQHTVSMLEGHFVEVDRQVEELHRTKIRLTEMIERAYGLDPAECDDPNRCQTISGLGD